MSTTAAKPQNDEARRREQAAARLQQARHELRWLGIRLPHAPPDKAEKSELAYLSAPAPRSVFEWPDAAWYAPRPAPRPPLVPAHAGSMSALDEIKHLAEQMRLRAQMERMHDEEAS